jgi:DnaJ like chaperone protein
MPYWLVGKQSASDQDIKRTYRKLMNEHHPDKLVAKGLPAEMMALAKTKAQDIQVAYERIKTSRGMR